MKVLHDIWIIFQRHMLLMVRKPLWVFLGVVQPVIYLALFAPLLKPALASVGARSMADAYRVYVPGMLVALAMAAGLYSGFGLLEELASGVVERTRVTPVSRAALLLGRSLRDVVMLMVQAGIIIVLSLPLGLFFRIQDLLFAYLTMALITLASASFSYGISIRVNNPNVLAQVMNNIAQPLWLLSGTLLPIALAPLWLRRAADWNPFNWAVNGMRALFDGHGDSPQVWQGLAIMAGFTAVVVAWSTRQFAKAVQ